MAGLMPLSNINEKGTNADSQTVCVNYTIRTQDNKLISFNCFKHCNKIKEIYTKIMKIILHKWNAFEMTANECR